jgi:NAD(P)-dependent dehydrogenase (short-subunit alcohol dehydrogenase family)
MDKYLNLEDKHIVITGASSGIGMETAILCSQLGAKVSLLGRNVDKLAEVTGKLKGDNHRFYSLDAKDSDKIEETIASIVTESGKIDGFVHCAGIEMTKPIKVLKLENLQDTFSTNVFFGFMVAKEVLKQKNINDNASVLFISSIVGLLGQAGKLAYSASKGALVSGSKSLALEFASKGIRINAVLPALVETEMSNNLLEKVGEEAKQSILKMHPLGFGKPIDVANSCVFLLSDLSRWITGTSFIIDGGYSSQ